MSPLASFTVLFVFPFFFFSLLNMVQFLFSFNRSILFSSLPPQAPLSVFFRHHPRSIRSTRTAFPLILLVFFLFVSFFFGLDWCVCKETRIVCVVSCRVAVSCSVMLCWDVWMAWSFRGMKMIYTPAGIQKANNTTWHGIAICENTGISFRTNDDRNNLAA